MLKIYLWKGWALRNYFIRAITKSNWSHAGFVDGDEVIEADMFSNNIVARKNVWKQHKDHYKEILLPFGKEKNRKIIQTARDFIGQAAYDYRLIVDHLFGYRKRYTLDCASKKKSFICSEFVACCIYKATGELLFPDRAPHTILPGELEVLEQKLSSEKIAAIG